MSEMDLLKSQIEIICLDLILNFSKNIQIKYQSLILQIVPTEVSLSLIFIRMYLNVTAAHGYFESAE